MQASPVSWYHHHLPAPRSGLRLWLTRLATTYGAGAMILFFCVGDQALGHAGMLPINATALCALSLTPFLLYYSLFHERPHSSRSGTNESLLAHALWNNRVVVVSLVLLAMTALLWSTLPSAYWGESGKWIAVVPYDVTILLCSMSLGLCSTLCKQLHIIILLSICFLLGSIWYDMTYPGTFAELGARAAGFPGNANFAALTAVVLCAAGLDFGDYSDVPGKDHKRTRSNFLLLIVTFITVALTMSRSGLVNFGILTFAYLFFRLIRSRAPASQRLKELIGIACICTVTFALMVWFCSTYGSSGDNSRLTRLLNNKQVDDGSAATRLSAVLDCIRLIEQSPFLGHGTGFSRTMSELPHNLYLQQWVNNGLLGILAYVGFLASAFGTFYVRGNRNGQALVLVAAVGSVFSHNVIDLRPLLILLGMFLADSAINQQRRGTRVLLVQRRIAPTPSAAPEVA